MQKYAEITAKLIVTNPSEVLCVDFTLPYTLMSKDGTKGDFMCFT